jgi:hypothetical protein
MGVCGLYVFVSCRGEGLCEVPIPPLEKSYRVCICPHTLSGTTRTLCTNNAYVEVSGVPRNFFREGGGVSPGIFFEGGSTNSVEDRGQRERRSGGGSPLVRGSTQFANPYSYYVVTDLFSTDLGIWPNFGIAGGFEPPKPTHPSVRHWLKWYDLQEVFCGSCTYRIHKSVSI